MTDDNMRLTGVGSGHWAQWVGRACASPSRGRAKIKNRRAKIGNISFCREVFKIIFSNFSHYIFELISKNPFMKFSNKNPF